MNHAHEGSMIGFSVFLNAPQSTGLIVLAGANCATRGSIGVSIGLARGLDWKGCGIKSFYSLFSKTVTKLHTGRRLISNIERFDPFSFLQSGSKLSHYKLPL